MIYDKFFLEGKLNPEEYKWVTHSPMWPIFVALHNATDGQVRISEVRGQAEMEFSTTEGFPFGIVRWLSSHKDDGTSKRYYAFDFWSHPLSPSGCMSKPELRSKNPKYIANKLKGMHSSIAYHLDKIRKMPTWVLDYIHEYGLCYSGKAFERIKSYPVMSIGRSEINSELLLQMVELACGEIDRTQLSAEVTTFCDKKLTELGKQRMAYDQMQAEYRSFFNKDKVLIFKNVNGGMVVAQLNKEFLNKSVDAVLNTWTDDPFNQTYKEHYRQGGKVLDSCKWYANLESIPDPLRTSIKVSLTMLKIHTNSDELFPNTSSFNTHAWSDIGMAAVHTGGYYPAFMLEI